MASLNVDNRTGNFLVRYRYAGKGYCRSAETTSKKEANEILARVERTLRLLKQGDKTMPPDADPGLWIFTGGALEAKPVAASKVTVGGICEAYLAEQLSKAESTRKTEKQHVGHLKRLLKESAAMERLTTSDMQKYVLGRMKEKWHGEFISSLTARKELVTFTLIWAWAEARGMVKGLCPVYSKVGKWAVQFEKPKAREPFQPWDAIAGRIARGDLSETQQRKMWESVFLNKDQVAKLLEHVKEKAEHEFVYPMFCFLAYTGVRRSEMVRSRIEDFDFAHNQIIVRSKKGDKSLSEGFRHVPLHPKLAEVMKEWFAKHPGGPYAITEPLHMRKRAPKTTWEPLSNDQSNHHFNHVLEKSEWKTLPGFHTLRHSFAAICAREGVPQAQVGAWMGHSTLEMQELYQHLFPEDGASRIKLVF